MPKLTQYRNNLDFHIMRLYEVFIFPTNLQLSYQNKRIDIQIYSYGMNGRHDEHGQFYYSFPYTAYRYDIRIQTYKQGRCANVFESGAKLIHGNSYRHVECTPMDIVDKISNPIKFNGVSMNRTFFLHDGLKRFLNIMPFIIQEKLDFKYTMRKPWSKIINEILS